MRLSSWEAAAAHLATRFPLDRLGDDRGQVRVPTVHGEELALEVSARSWRDTRWLCVGGVVGSARHADPASLIAANNHRLVGVFEVTREGEVWLRHSLLLDGLLASDLDAVVDELVVEIGTRRRSMPRSKT